MSELEKRLKRVGEHFRYLRTSKKISQAKLAQAIQMDVRHLQRIEKGEKDFRMSTYWRIEDALKGIPHAEI